MPGQFLTTAERERIEKFPQEIPREDVITFFTLTPSDLNHIPTTSADYNRLGFALQLCALRYLGFCPDEVKTAPKSVITHTANQLGINSPSLDGYGQRAQTRTDHLLTIQEYLGFRRATEPDLSKLSEWLLKRALEHDKPTLLFQMACQKLYIERIVRPGVTTLERMVIQAKKNENERTRKRENETRFASPSRFRVFTFSRFLFFWLRYGATANTPKNILAAIEKLDFLREGCVDKWDISSLNPNRQKCLAQIGRGATNQALKRMNEQRRYPILLAFLRQSLIDIIDELIKDENEKTGKRENVSMKLPSLVFAFSRFLLFLASVEECDKLIRPKDDQSIDYFASRYSYIREFAPQFLDALKFQSNKADDPLIGALELIRMLNATCKRKVPEDAPLAFIPQSWLDYVLDEKDRIVRRYYELSTLWELRGARCDAFTRRLLQRSGDIWVKNSRKYANPETYLIPKDKWPTIRPEALRLLGLSEKGEERLEKRKAQLQRALSHFDKKLSNNDDVKIEKGKLVISPLQAEDLPPSSVKLRELVDQRLPLVDLTDLLIEVDGWTNFTDCFEHPTGHQPRTIDLLTHLFASILAGRERLHYRV